MQIRPNFNEDVGDHLIRSMISCFNNVFRQQFCNLTIKNGTFLSRESGLWAFSVTQLGVELNCSPSDRRQNFLIRGNHLPVANGSVMQPARK